MKGDVLARLAALLIAAALPLVAGAFPSSAQTVIDGGSVVTVPGTVASPWNLGGSLTVGLNSQGTLIIQNGGQVSSRLTNHVGRAATAVGSVTVTGAGSTWNIINGELHFGGSGGTATVVLSDGGRILTNGAFGMRAAFGGNVDISVSGTNSLLRSNGATDIGSGTSLTVSDNGTVHSNVFRLTGTGVLNIGAPAGSAATAPGNVTTVFAPGVTLNGADTRLVFNHTGTAYTFSRVVSLTGQIAAYSGTTLLTATNTYTGGTALNGGVVEVSADANLGGAAGVLIFDGGTLRTTASFSMARATTLNAGGGTFDIQSGTLTHSGVIAGGGGLIKTGAGTLILSAANTYTGNTTVGAGTLALPSGASLAGPGTVTVASGAMLGGYGTIDGTVVNNGTIAVGNALPTFTGGVTGNFTILGPATLINNDVVVIGAAGTPVGNTLTTVSYVGGAGSVIRFNTVLGGDGSASDRLIVDGGTATGNSALAVTNVGGAGVLTTGNGIQVVSAINGATTASGAFTLSAPVIAGPYEYLLFRGARDGSDPQSWFLRSAIDCAQSPNDPTCQQAVAPGGASVVANLRQEVSLYTAIPSMALIYGQALMGTLHQRAGEPQRLPAGAGFGNGWGRMLGRHGSREGGRGGVLGGDGPAYTYDIFALQLGTDLYRREGGDGSRDSGGAYVAFGQIAGAVRHVSGAMAGHDTLQAWSLGAYWTHVGALGWYVDAVVQGTWYDARGQSSRNMAALQTYGFGLAASLEGGYPIALAPGWTLEPQAQLIWQRIWLNSADDGAATVQFDDVESIAGRLGARLMTTWQELANEALDDRRIVSAWLRASLWHEFSGRSTTTFSSANGPVPFRAGLGGTSVEFTLGVTAQFARATSFFATASYQVGFQRNAQAYDGRAGLRIAW